MKSTIRTIAAASVVGISALTLTGCRQEYKSPTAQTLPDSFPVHFQENMTHTPACIAYVEAYQGKEQSSGCNRLNLIDRDRDGIVDESDGIPALYTQKQAQHNPKLTPVMTEEVQAAANKLRQAHLRAIAAWPKHLYVIPFVHMIDQDGDGKFDTFGGYSRICTAQYAARNSDECDPKQVIPKEAMPALDAFFDEHREAALKIGTLLYETTYKKF